MLCDPEFNFERIYILETKQSYSSVLTKVNVSKYISKEQQ